MTPKTLTPTSVEIARIDIKNLRDGNYSIEAVGVVTYSDRDGEETRMSKSLKYNLADSEADRALRAVIAALGKSLANTLGLPDIAKIGD